MGEQLHHAVFPAVANGAHRLVGERAQTVSVTDESFNQISCAYRLRGLGPGDERGTLLVPELPRSQAVTAGRVDDGLHLGIEVVDSFLSLDRTPSTHYLDKSLPLPQRHQTVALLAPNAFERRYAGFKQVVAPGGDFDHAARHR